MVVCVYNGSSPSFDVGDFTNQKLSRSIWIVFCHVTDFGVGVVMKVPVKFYKECEEIQELLDREFNFFFFPPR